MTDWTVRFDRTVHVDEWADGKDPEAIAGLHAWLATCAEEGPPVDSWLVEVEDVYRYRYWIIEVNVTVEFIAVTHERWMMVKRID